MLSPMYILFQNVNMSAPRNTRISQLEARIEELKEEIRIVEERYLRFSRLMDALVEELGLPRLEAPQTLALDLVPAEPLRLAALREHESVETRLSREEARAERGGFR